MTADAIVEARTGRTPAPLRVWESHLVVLRRMWRTEVLLSFAQPLLFLVGMGFGVGALIDGRAASTDSLGGVAYVAFLAPGLMATTAMLVGAGETLWPVLGGFKWDGSYESMAASPLRAVDVVNGQVLWWSTRMAIQVTGVTAVLAVIPDTRTWRLLPAAAIAVAGGVCFAVWIATWSATREYDSSFSLVQRFVITPLFLFGGAFYPTESLPAPLEALAVLTPLWHTVELCRGAVLGTLEAGPALAHGAVLAAYLGAGWWACFWSFRRRLHR